MLTPRLEGLLLGRALVVTFLLGAALLFQYSQSTQMLWDEELLVSLSPIYGCVIFVYVLSILYAWIYRGVAGSDRGARRFALAQIAIDALVVSYLLVVSGGARSVFPFLYLLIVLYAGILMAGRGAFLSAALCSIAYPLALESIVWMPTRLTDALELFGTYRPASEEVLYASFVNMSTNFLTAALVAYLTERLRRTGEQLARREIDYRALEELHRQIVTNLSSGIITVDAQGRITYLNQAAEQMLGNRIGDVYHEQLDRVFPAIAQAVVKPSAKDPWRRPEVRVQGSDGLELDLGFSVTPLGERPGVPEGTIIIFQDLTNLKQAEERLKRVDRLAAIGEMAASIAHEIRNPLASISGSIQLLGKGEHRGGQEARLMAVIQREIGRLDTLISNFLHYSRPMPLQLKELDLRELLDEVLVTLGPLEDPPVKVDVVCEGEDFRLRGDPDQLKQVLWNLLLNARQALEPSGGQIEVRLFRKGGKGLKASCGLSVTDSGPGVPPDALKRIFTPFFTTRPDGSGLGLALVDRIVGLHGGRVEVGNVPEGGASFTITLPLQPPLDAELSESRLQQQASWGIGS